MNPEDLYLNADLAGKAKVAELVQSNGIVPMRVVQPANPLDSTSPAVAEYFVEDGVCGFAWVNIKPGNSKFANWLKKNRIGRKDSYYGGVSIWISKYNQSMQKKYAYAQGFAAYLKEQGYDKVYAASRMD